MKTVTVSEFEASCLDLLAKVQRTGEPILVTEQGKPLAQVGPPPGPARKSWLGSMAGTVHIFGDIVAPALDPSEYGDADWSNVRTMFEPSNEALPSDHTSDKT
jgi:prevent-host-death family protein